MAQMASVERLKMWLTAYVRQTGAGSPMTPLAKFHFMREPTGFMVSCLGTETSLMLRLLPDARQPPSPNQERAKPVNLSG